MNPVESLQLLAGLGALTTSAQMGGSFAKVIDAKASLENLGLLEKRQQLLLTTIEAAHNPDLGFTEDDKTLLRTAYNEGAMAIAKLKIIL